MSRFGNLIGGTPQQPEPEPKVEEVVEQPKRARDDNGHFIADDPSTPENEAWEGGVAPKRTTRKRRSKKS